MLRAAKQTGCMAAGNLGYLSGCASWQSQCGRASSTYWSPVKCHGKYSVEVVGRRSGEAVSHHTALLTERTKHMLMTSPLLLSPCDAFLLTH